MKEKMIKAFLELYGGESDDVEAFFSPGRVNLIGEHIDYNGGYVFPCALDFGTYAVVRKTNSNKVNFATLNFDIKVSTDLNNVEYRVEDDWTNYPKGVIKMFQEEGYKVSGMDILYYGNIPNGAGLSSSASLEVLTAVIINDLFDFGIDRIELVKLSQRSENKFVGVNCGIMDQFAVGMGKKDNAILLDCNTLEYTYAPLILNGVKLVIGNTKKRRGLADSKYNERRGECEYALSKLQQVLPIKSLCELDEATFIKHQQLIDNPLARNRAKHAVLENERTKKAVNALNQGDLKSFGELINASHVSLRDLYEVTGFELDTMVEEALKVEGTIGSRMTGAGFGGCTISIVKESAVDNFIKTVGENYESKTGLKPEFYVANVGSGASRLY